MPLQPSGYDLISLNPGICNAYAFSNINPALGTGSSPPETLPVPDPWVCDIEPW